MGTGSLMVSVRLEARLPVDPALIPNLGICSPLYAPPHQGLHDGWHT